MIRSRALGPGERLRQADIAARFGVSTTPVREAFAVLAQEGLVRQDAHRGVVVFEPSLEELTETFEIRQALEPLATALAAERLTEDDLAALGKIVAEMRTATPRTYFELNRSFHRRIYAAAGRKQLFELIEQLRTVSTSYVAMSVREYDPAYRDQVHAEHEDILVALIDRDGARAGELIRQHLQNNFDHIATLVQREPR
jgi:DNA-binding GntR family transcriptional regulator